MPDYLLVAAGGALGSVARHWLSVTFHEFDVNLYPFVLMPVNFPWPTLFINITGSLVIGFVANLPLDYITRDTRLLLMVGICGGFTTYSSFSLQLLDMMIEGDFAIGMLYIFLTLTVGLFAVALGYVAASLLY
ncbi:MAG: fluoride efflux transporter CrcB [Rhodospirillaceae bacterium]